MTSCQNLLKTTQRKDQLYKTLNISKFHYKNGFYALLRPELFCFITLFYDSCNNFFIQVRTLVRLTLLNSFDPLYSFYSQILTITHSTERIQSLHFTSRFEWNSKKSFSTGSCVADSIQNMIAKCCTTN